MTSDKQEGFELITRHLSLNLHGVSEELTADFELVTRHLSLVTVFKPQSNCLVDADQSEW